MVNCRTASAQHRHSLSSARGAFCSLQVQPCQAGCVLPCSVFATLIPKFVSIPASALPLAFINLIGFVPPVSGVAQEQSFSVKVSQQPCCFAPCWIAERRQRGGNNKRGHMRPPPLHRSHVPPTCHRMVPVTPRLQCRPQAATHMEHSAAWPACSCAQAWSSITSPLSFCTSCVPSATSWV